MSLLQMSFSGAVLIVVVMVIRAAAVHRLPKKTFLVLWGIVLSRLLIPYDIPSAVSVYSFVGQGTQADTYAAGELAAVISAVLQGQTNAAREMQQIPPDAAGQEIQQIQSGAAGQERRQVLPNTAGQERQQIQSGTAEQGMRQILLGGAALVFGWHIIWCVGMVSTAAFFAISYLHCLLDFQASLPVQNDFARKWLEEHRLKRTVAIRQSDKISAPLTYGIFRPVILMPKKTDWNDTKQLQYILLHEYVHICRYDTLIKLVCACALCIHWFNPFVWVMHVLFCRDIELACDESVVRRFGETSRPAYARMLIGMEEKKSGFLPFYSSLSKNAAEERITAIMKIRKTSKFAIITAAVLTAGVAAVFASSAGNGADNQNQPSVTAASAENGADNQNQQTVTAASAENGADNQNQQPAAAAPAGSSMRTWYEPLEEDEDILQGIENERREDWERALAPYTVFGLAYSYDESADDYKMYYQGKEVRGIYDETAQLWITEHSGIGTYSEDAVELYAVYENGTLAGLREGTAKEQAEWAKMRQETASRGNVSETRPYAAGTEEDYRLLFALQTPDYQNMSVADFNKDLLEWENENYECANRIGNDRAWHDYHVALSDEEKSFAALTVWASEIENWEFIKSLNTGNPKQDPVVGDNGLEKEEVSASGSRAWCSLCYQFSYHIADEKTVTVGERDRSVGGMINGIQKFWDKTSLDDMLGMSERSILKKLRKIAAKHSSSRITFTVLADRTKFECIDERGID